MLTEVEPQEAKVIRFTKPQFELISTKAKFPAMVAGFGAGKTNGLVYRMCHLKINYPRQAVGYYLPTYDLVSKIAYPRFEEALYELGYPFKINKLDKEIWVEDHGKIILRTLDTPSRIIGYEHADGGIDELDTLKEDDARDVWRKILARNRQKKPDDSENTLAVGTTPEGYRFVYQQWDRKPPSKDYVLIRASTYSNERNLPADYIENLKAAYPSNLIQAYLEGEFVNLTSGAVYPDYDRVLNGSTEQATPIEPLHIGMDFNVGAMAAAVCVPRQGIPHAVDEIVGILDTPAMIRAIKLRYPNNTILVYPDASGANRKSNDASVSDISLLKSAGFTVVANNSNPRVKDRVLSMNSLIFVPRRLTERMLRVNVAKCPTLAEALEKQAYDKHGEPDKMSGLDHIVDAIGYFVTYRFPLRKSNISQVKAAGV